MDRHRRLAALAAVLLTGTLVACGDDDDSADTTVAGGADTTVGEPVATSGSTAPGSTAPGSTAPGSTAPGSTAPGSTAPGSTAPGSTAPAGTTGGTVDADEDEYVEAIVTELGGDEDTSRCIAEELIAAVGADQLNEKGVTPEALADQGGGGFDLTFENATADEVDAAIADCGDLLALLLADQEATPEEEACATEHLTNEVVAQVVASSFVGEEPNAEAQQASTDFQACVAESGE